MTNDEAAFEAGYQQAVALYGEGKSRDDLPEGTAKRVEAEYGFSGSFQWWAGFDRGAWWMGSTTRSSSI